MTAEAARPAPSIGPRPRGALTASRSHTSMMTLGELVDRYRALAGAFGNPVALSAFGLSPADTERLFGGYDEDYHISRFFRFAESEGARYSINGAPATHVSLDPEIQSIL